MPCRRQKRRVARAASHAGGTQRCAHPDWEGSWRLASSPSRTAAGELAYSPYGAAYAGSGPDAFTGQWVDTPDNLNDFPRRFLQPMMGRWLSPDPAGLAAVNPAEPQTWNAYAYVADTPLEATDPLGLMTTAGSCAFSACVVAPMPPPPGLYGYGTFSLSGLGSPLLQGLGLGSLPQENTSLFGPSGGAAPLNPTSVALSHGGGGAASPSSGKISFSINVAWGPSSGPQSNIFNCPGCAQIWQNADGAINASWYGTLALASFGLSDLAEGAGAAGALLSRWQSAAALAVMTSPAAFESAQAAQDFLAGWNGWQSATNPNVINAAGAETHRIVQCPPWDAWAGNCG